MMRENGFDTPIARRRRRNSPSCATREERRPHRLLAIQPMLHMSHKDLWQLYMLGK